MLRIALGAIALASAPAVSAAPIALTNVTLIDGTGAAPVSGATIVFDENQILAAGKNVQVPPHAQVIDRKGATVLPMLVSDHVHVGQVGGADTGAQNYTRSTIAHELAQYRSYGVGTVAALGNNGALFDQLRVEAHAGKLPADLFGVDQGIGVPQGAPPQAMLKVGPDQLYRPATPADAVRAVDQMAAAGTDLVKIWLDDFGGSLPVKMQPEIYTAVIAESHRLGLRVAAHIHDLGDANAMIDAGADILAHGVRDKPVDAGFAARMKQNGIWYIATLALDEATFAWAEQQPWTIGPLARAALSPELAAQIDDPAWRARTLTTPSMQSAHKSLAMNMRNLKFLTEQGVRIGFGTDSGATPLRVPGIAEHREIALSIAAGLDPLRAIRMATGDAAAMLDLDDRGVISAGRRPDLVVVSGNPLRDPAALDRIVESWSGGHSVAGPIPVTGK